MGNKLKQARRKKMMTQEELAQKSGVSRNTIISIEKNGEGTASTVTLFKLATALGTTVDKIFFQKSV